jgi:hypothetical protein
MISNRIEYQARKSTNDQHANSLLSATFLFALGLVNESEPHFKTEFCRLKQVSRIARHFAGTPRLSPKSPYLTTHNLERRATKEHFAVQSN